MLTKQLLRRSLKYHYLTASKEELTGDNNLREMANSDISIRRAYTSCIVL